MNTASVRKFSITILPAAAVLAVMFAVSTLLHVPIADLARDPAAIGQINPLSGALSNLGNLLWCASASICLFSAVVIRQVQPKEIFWFLLCSALLSGYLLFDDFFMIHERLLPKYVGFDEKVVYVGLGITTAIYLVVFRRIILSTDFVLLALALGFFGFSIVVDAVLTRWINSVGTWTFIWEDGSKWLGITCWCSYFAHTAFHFVTKSFAHETADTDNE